MLGKKSGPVIGKLIGNRGIPGITEVATSPRSPLELKNIQSPRGGGGGGGGIKNYDVGDGIGLGIVAALERCSTDDDGDGGEIQLKRAVYGGQNYLNRSTTPTPIPVLNKHSEMDSLELDYTYVSTTCHNNNNNNNDGANYNCKSSYTRVYFNGVNHDEYGTTIGLGHDVERTGFDIINKTFGVASSSFDITPARFGQDINLFPTSDFLSSCYLCRKKLHGKDIYMYRGEKAFCSTECRYREIVMDEQLEEENISS